jgi:heparan-sulfate lyase
MRSSWDKDAICLVLKCGPDGGFHCQPDNGTFVLYAGERHLMPDSGSYNYGSEEPKKRAWFQQTKVHQTLTLNGKNSAYAPKLLLWQPGKELDRIVVENQSYPQLKHRRALLFVEKKFFVFVDEAIGKAVGNVDLHFQLAPGRAIYDHQNMLVRSDFANSWNVFVQTVDQRGLLLQKEKGQVSFVYDKKESRPAFRYRIHKDGSQGARFVTIVVPYKSSAPEVSAQIIGTPKIGASHIDIKVVAERWGIEKDIDYTLCLPYPLQ